MVMEKNEDILNPSVKATFSQVFVNRISVYIIITAVISLLMTITNLVPLSLLVVIWVPVFPLLFLKNPVQPKYIITLLLMLAYFFIHALQYDASSLMSPQFYRRDGNVFVTMLPVLILTQVRIKIDLSRLLKAFIIFSASVNFVLIVVYLITGGTVFLFEHDIFHSLFIAHNAAGGFLSILTAFSLGLLFYKRTPLHLGLVLIHSYALWISDSRGSILAVVIAVGICLFDHIKTLHRIIVFLLILSQILLAAWVYRKRYLEGVTRDNAAFVAGRRIWTMYDRMFNLWPRSIHHFKQSPVFGTGFGSYNDTGDVFESGMGWFPQKVPDRIIHSAAHAHHTFFHVLAETGLVGLLFLLLFLRHLRMYILDVKPDWIRLSLLLGYWVSVISSFTEHRLFAPAQMLPYLIVLGFAGQKKTLPEDLQKAGEERDHV